MARPARCTQSQIARHAGVSQAAVSFALRNHPAISPATRRRIRTLAAKLGYRPNPLVSAVMAGLHTAGPRKHLGTLAFLTSFPTADGWRRHSPLYIGYYEGAQERAEALGFRLEEIWAKEPGMTGARLTKILQTRGIRGLIVAPLFRPAGHLSLEWSRFSSVAMGYSMWRPEVHRIADDQFQNMTLALRHLRHLGYERIGLNMTPGADQRTNHNYLAAYLAYQYRVPSASRVPVLFSEGPDERAFVAWLRQRKPDAVVSGWAKIEEWVRNANLSVPMDIGLVHLNWHKALGSWAGVDPRSPCGGAAAVDLVVEQLQFNQLGIPAVPRRSLIQGRWVDGRTVRSRRTLGDPDRRRSAMQGAGRAE